MNDTIPTILRAPEQLGILIRGQRKRLGLTQQALAARLGLSQRRLSELERAPQLLSLAQLLALCSLLNIRVLLQPQPQSEASGPASAGAAGDDAPQW